MASVDHEYISKATTDQLMVRKTKISTFFPWLGSAACMHAVIYSH